MGVEHKHKVVWWHYHHRYEEEVDEDRLEKLKLLDRMGGCWVEAIDGRYVDWRDKEDWPT